MTNRERSRFRRICSRMAAVVAFVTRAAMSYGQPSEPSAPPVPPSAPASNPDKKAEAKSRFERGMSLMREGAWDAALAEFLHSRELFATRGNTQNAAVCLDKLHRFDEALDMFEKLLSEFTNLTPDERTQVETEMTTLRSRIGTIDIGISEPGAAVAIDGRQRATTPVSAPIRVSVGSHLVRIYKEGFAPIERRVEVAGRQNTAVEGQLTALTRSGRLKIVEQSGQTVDVIIDNSLVGKTPWEGPLDVGSHAVLLRGAGNIGTQPVSVPIRLNEVTPITLAAEPLECELRVQPSPMNALVELDGVGVGRGLWDGRVRAGHHRVEIAAEGFLPARRSIALVAGERSVVAVELDRDTTSPLWQAQNPPRFTIDVQAAPAITPSLGGDLTSGCASPCSKGLGLGVLATLRGGYQLSSGIGFSLDLGYLFLTEALSQRQTSLLPQGLTPDPGKVDDRLSLQGLMAGASAALHTRGRFPVLIRLGGGVLLGAIGDTRSGRFTTTLTGVPPTAYDIGPLSASERLVYAYVAPEARLAYRLGSHVELGIAAQAMMLFALSQPQWPPPPDLQLYAGHCGKTGDQSCEGLAHFGDDYLVGKVFVVLTPAVELRLDF